MEVEVSRVEKSMCERRGAWLEGSGYGTTRDRQERAKTALTKDRQPRRERQIYERTEAEYNNRTRRIPSPRHPERKAGGRRYMQRARRRDGRVGARPLHPTRRDGLLARWGKAEWRFETRDI